MTTVWLELDPSSDASQSLPFRRRASFMTKPPRIVFTSSAGAERGDMQVIWAIRFHKQPWACAENKWTNEKLCCTYHSHSWQKLTHIHSCPWASCPVAPVIPTSEFGVLRGALAGVAFWIPMPISSYICSFPVPSPCCRWLLLSSTKALESHCLWLRGQTAWPRLQKESLKLRLREPKRRNFHRFLVGA